MIAVRLWTKRRSLFLILCALFGSAGAEVIAQSASPPAVLVLYSYHDQSQWQQNLHQGIVSALSSHSGRLTLFEERLDASRFTRPEDASRFADYIGQKYAGRGLDMVISLDAPAAQLLAANPQLLPGVPRSSVTLEKSLLDTGGLSDSASLLLRSDFVAGFHEVRRLRPTSTIHIVGDSTAPYVHAALERLGALLPSSDGPPVHFFLDRSLDEVLRYVSDLSPQDAVYFTLMFGDGERLPLLPRQALDAIVENSPAPVFVHFDTLIGSGAVGGLVSSGHAMGELAGTEILAGVFGAPYVHDDLRPLTYIYDEAALQQHGMSRAGLLPGSRLVNEQLSLWGQYREAVLWAMGAIILLIVVGAVVTRAWIRASSSEAALRRSQEQLAAAQAIAHIGSWSGVPGSDVLNCSGEMIRILGLDSPASPCTEITWAELSARIYADDQSDFALRSVALVTGDSEIDAEYRLVRGPGDVRVVHMVGRVNDAGRSGRRIDGFIHDVTELHEHQRRRLQRERQDAVWHLAGGMGHHFNNLFTGLLGNAELLALKVSNQEQAGFVQEIVEHVESAADLNRKLLGFCRQGVLKPVAVPMSELVLACEVELHALVHPPATLTIQSYVSQWNVMVDAGATLRALKGLVSNALEAGSRNAHGASRVDIDITVQDVSVNALEAVKFCGLEPGEYVQVSVEDNGPGMLDEVAQRAFDPFFSTKPPGDGAGMGLSTIYGYMQQIGGDVTLSSVPGTGTTVTLYLPRTTQGVLSNVSAG